MHRVENDFQSKGHVLWNNGQVGSSACADRVENGGAWFGALEVGDGFECGENQMPWERIFSPQRHRVTESQRSSLIFSVTLCLGGIPVSYSDGKVGEGRNENRRVNLRRSTYHLRTLACWVLSIYDLKQPRTESVDSVPAFKPQS